MDGVTLVAMVIAVGAVTALVAAVVPLVRLQRRVDAVLSRLGTAPTRHRGRALYRAVRHLEREREAAEASAERHRIAVAETDLGILMTDRRGAVRFSNAAADELLLPGTRDAVVSGRIRQVVDRVTRSGDAEEIEFDLHTPVRRMLRLRALPVPDDEGKGHGVLVYLTDLTDRRRIEVMRRDFVANAGHELKTPLGALSVLAETLADADDPEVRRRLSARLASEAARMAGLVDDILELAAIESLETPHVPTAVAEVLVEAEAAVALGAEEAGVALVGKAPPGDVLVSGDHGQLVSAVSNLLDNAIKYTVAGGGGGTVWYRAWREDAGVVVEVEDHGIGIAEEQQERIFERFYRVDRGRARASGGTGLGLSIVRNVAESHGGEITVRSELGRGSTFTMTLPALEE